ncbi:hypothetical protein KC357_g203 [Hortaea werneckii]|nr:hypothetical protein KC357_g203 [Hortaea werneckii]
MPITLTVPSSTSFVKRWQVLQMLHSEVDRAQSILEIRLPTTQTSAIAMCVGDVYVNSRWSDSMTQIVAHNHRTDHRLARRSRGAGRAPKV